VYDLEDKESSIQQTEGGKKPIASASRFVTAMREHGSKDKLVFFSGDLFAPDKMSYFFKGQNMVPLYNACNIDVTCLGNHDTDQGSEVLEKLLSLCNSPWIISNFFMPDGKTSFLNLK
jgi:2',3'-cyclic-nucleotide 2'-phosphodiesterase (5'-nucleotidase family)